MKLTTTTQVSVDGVMQANGGPNVLDVGFERAGWARPLFGGAAMTFVDQVYQRADAFLFGRRDLRALRRLLGREGRSGEPHRGCLEHKAQVRRIEHAHRAPPGRTRPSSPVTSRRLSAS
jgi:hypothetical protein